MRGRSSAKASILKSSNLLHSLRWAILAGMLLFLDFDGVLRPASSPPLTFDPKCLALFEATVLALPRWEIAITSSWRDLETLSQIRSRFSPPVALRIVGAVPTVIDGSDYPRHREVLEFLLRRGRARERWIGIDDDPRAYPPTCRVVLTNPAVGFDEAAAEKVGELSAAAPWLPEDP